MMELTMTDQLCVTHTQAKCSNYIKIAVLLQVKFSPQLRGRKTTTPSAAAQSGAGAEPVPIRRFHVNSEVGVRHANIPDPEPRHMSVDPGDVGAAVMPRMRVVIDATGRAWDRSRIVDDVKAARLTIGTGILPPGIDQEDCLCRTFYACCSRGRPFSAAIRRPTAAADVSVVIPVSAPLLVWLDDVGSIERRTFLDFDKDVRKISALREPGRPGVIRSGSCSRPDRAVINIKVVMVHIVI